MLINERELYGNLSQSLTRLNRHYEAEVERIEKYIATLPYPDGVTIYDIVKPDGTSQLLLIERARAEILSALVALNNTSKKGK